MLVWINGPFGGGKTATAYELSRRLPGSVVCDPEHVGFGMRRMLPAALRGNFQDLPAAAHAALGCVCPWPRLPGPACHTPRDPRSVGLIRPRRGVA
jgi:hypothetical protein